MNPTYNALARPLLSLQARETSTKREASVTARNERQALELPETHFGGNIVASSTEIGFGSLSGLKMEVVFVEKTVLLLRLSSYTLEPDQKVIPRRLKGILVPDESLHALYYSTKMALRKAKMGIRISIGITFIDFNSLGF